MLNPRDANDTDFLDDFLSTFVSQLIHEIRFFQIAKWWKRHWKL